ncbi:DUF4440 domain-containing protein [Serratia sp. DD3]|uniref:YybH family protein n=1 Tax=Serratia sp. DD3 TaxID=1410619 RepID=UPI0004D8FAFB|nr:nuclear transport factor 2 family protein [Serratia sp. DD3]KEY60631.1 calcium/calmodulin dependent protein kinase II association [Serratia sp. DD3]
MKYHFTFLRRHAIALSLFSTLAGVSLSPALAAPASTIPYTGDAAMHAAQLQVYEVINQYQNALNKGDTQAILKLYAKDGVAEWENTQTASTPEQLKKDYDGLFKVTKTSADFIYDAIEVSGDMAFVRTHHPVGQTAVVKGKKVEDHSRELFILRKIDGDWKIALYTFSTDPVQGQG